MPSFELADSLTIKPDGSNGGDVISDNGETYIFRSATQNNNSDLENLRVVVEYESADDNPNSAYFLKAIVETKGQTTTKWIPLIEQNNGVKGDSIGSRPDVKIFEINPSIFDQTFGGTLDQSNKQYQFRQGKPAEEWRVSIFVEENRFGTPDAFTEAVVSVYGDIS